MDGQRFDALTKALTSATSRRRVLRGLAGSPIGGLGLAVARGGADAAICPSGKRSYGSFCTTNAQCQSGFCFKPENGNNRCLCRDLLREPCSGPCSPCPGAGPCGGCAENCSFGVERNCGPEGFCACVRNADGGNACVERFCSFDACTTGAECPSGLCIVAPGCCGSPNRFCGTRCGSTPPNSGAREGGQGWR